MRRTAALLKGDDGIREEVARFVAPFARGDAQLRRRARSRFRTISPVIRTSTWQRAAFVMMLAASLGIALSGCAGEATEPFTRHMSDLELGQCFDVSADGAFALVKPDCSWQHDHELFARKKLEGATFPGDAAVAESANEFCTAEYITRMAAPPSDNARFSVEYFAPSSHSWAEGDRTVLCSMVSASGQPSTGSAFAGSAAASSGPTATP